MSIKQLVRDDDAVSPVIGVILMVTITVILSAVIGAFVLGIGGDLEQTPNSNIAVSADSDWDDTNGDRAIIIDQNGGDTLQSDDVRIIVRNSDGDRLETIDDLQADGNSNRFNSDHSSDTFGVGDRIGLVSNADSLQDDDSNSLQGQEVTVQLIHKPSDGVITSKTITLNS